MFFLIRDGELVPVKREEYESCSGEAKRVAVFSLEEIQRGEARFREKQMADERGKIHCCKVICWQSCIHAMVQIPVVYEARKPDREANISLLGQGRAFRYFSFYVSAKELVFLDYDDVAAQFLRSRRKWKNPLTLEELLYRLMMSLVEDDILLIDWIYRQLAILEGEIPRDSTRFFLQRMSAMKQTIYQMFRYYHQLTEFAQEMIDGKDVCFDGDGIGAFSDLIDRTGRLADEVEVMREYANEVWEIYQAQINIRQNDIMKVLTIVTTIFLPLSLLAGWYGMNFAYMPELSWKYGYLFVIALSLGIIAFCLILFKKKKYW